MRDRLLGYVAVVIGLAMCGLGVYGAYHVVVALINALSQATPYTLLCASIISAALIIHHGLSSGTCCKGGCDRDEEIKTKFVKKEAQRSERGGRGE